jgi:arginine deiminase
MNNIINLNSEIGKLKTLIVHEPGLEIELMTPRESEEQNFLDIVHYEGAIKAHKELQGILGLVCKNVLKLEDLLLQTLKKQNLKEKIINTVIKIENCPQLYQKLMDLKEKDLVDVLIRGEKSSPASITSYLVNKSYAIPPLPNLFFVRDIAMAYTNKLILGSMAINSRIREANIVSTVLEDHFKLDNLQILLNGPELINSALKIEGGDFHVLNKDLICVGLSERTNTLAVDYIVDKIIKTRTAEGNDKPFNIILNMLPKYSTTIHLDMVFSLIGNDEAVVYPPNILNPWMKNTIRVEVKVNGNKTFYEDSNLINALKKLKIDIKPISCGGSTDLYQQREQWASGCNFFTFAPYKAIGYNVNKVTLEELSKNNYNIVSAEALLKNKALINSKKLIVTIDGTELSRGAGGCRCMTLPLEREEI